jgi:hypothetical protein
VLIEFSQSISGPSSTARRLDGPAAAVLLSPIHRIVTHCRDHHS